MLTIVLLAILAIVGYVFTVWNNDYWKKRQVPFEAPTFFFGNFKDVALGRKHFGVMYKDLYRKFEHLPYFGYFKLRDPSLMINDPELIRNILVKDFASFSDNDFQVNPEIDKVWAENIFSQTGEKWKKNRNAWTVGMTTSKIKSIYERMQDRSDIMIEYLKKHVKSNPNEPLETAKLSSKLFTDMVISSILEMDINSFEDENNTYRKILNSLMSPSTLDSVLTLTFILAPWLSKFIKMRFLPKQMEQDLIFLAKEVIENRKVSGFKKNNPFDSMIMHGREERGITDVEVAGFLFGFMLDATETAAGVLGYILYSLAANKDIQERLRDEIDESRKKYDNGIIPYDEINKLTYLDMVVSETLRMYTPATAIQRLCTKPYELKSVYKGSSPFLIPKGMPITIPIYGLHMDENYFPDPETFDPERFSEENRSKIPKFAYIPFGDGPRTCIGTKFAMIQLKIGVISILNNFELRPAPKMIGKPLTVDPNIFILRNLGGLWVTFRERS